jgi:hypothetical protein
VILKFNNNKIALASNLQKFAEKGKATPTTTTGALWHDLKQPFENATPDDLPALFQAKSLSTTKRSTVNMTSSSYASDFSSVENQVTTMVGEEPHVATTGLDQQGRRVRKTKKIYCPRNKPPARSPNNNNEEHQLRREKALAMTGIMEQTSHWSIFVRNEFRVYISTTKRSICPQRNSKRHSK